MRYNESRGQHLDVPHMLTVVAVIGRLCEIRKGATDDRPYESLSLRRGVTK